MLIEFQPARGRVGKQATKIEQLRLKVSLPQWALVEGPDGELDVAEDPPVLRLAMCKVFKLQAMQAELHVAQEIQVEPQLHAIDCQDIIVPLACAQPGRRAAGPPPTGQRP